MKKGKKIGISIAVALVVIIAAGVVWQWDNISAIYMGITYSDQKIESKIGETKEKLGEKLEQEVVVNKKIIEGFSKEDEEKIASGEMSIEEAVDKLFEEETPEDADTEHKTGSSDTSINNEQASQNNTESNTQTEVKKEDTVQNQQSNNSESKALIESAVKEMYTLKAQYVQKLAAFESTAKEIYIQGEMTTERKFEIADVMMPQLLQAEKTCDAQVETVLGNLKEKLSAIGADTSVVDYIREQYKNEKQLQKSKYINKYM